MVHLRNRTLNTEDPVKLTMECVCVEDHLELYINFVPYERSQSFYLR